jgi:hypothetical protein
MIGMNFNENRIISRKFVSGKKVFGDIGDMESIA